MSRRLVAYTVAGVALATALAAGAAAGASGRGSLDPSFGDGGRVVVNGIRECLPGEGGCWAGIGMALQRNGMIVTAGGTLDSDCGSRFAVARLRRSGRPDRAFGNGGRVLTAFGRSAVAHAVVILPDSRIVVGGELVDTTSPCPDHLHLGDGSKGFALARYRPDGTLDRSFGGDGRVVTHFEDGAGLDVLLQRDGKVVVIGASNGRLALARYSGDGSLDQSFGQYGLVIGRFASVDIPGRAELDKAGRILVPVSGWCGDCPAYVVRYKADGRLDTAFGHRGRAALALLGINAVAAFHGRIVVAGLTTRGREVRQAVSRLSPSGKLDRRFGRNGTRVLQIGGWGLPVLAIQKNGVILVASGARPHGVKGFNFTLTRILPNGAVDRSFGRNGTVTDDFGGSDFGQAVSVQANGKLLVAGAIGRVADGVGLARHLP